MPTVNTVRVRQDWFEHRITQAGSLSGLADELQTTVSTISRYAREQAEAGPRFIGSVLTTYPVEFADAFYVSTEKIRPQRRRPSKRSAA